jgi:hypothetical protein
LKNHPLKTWNGADYVMQAYIPTDDGYQYYTRLGFAFTDLGITTDFNKDGILDRKIKFTLLDYEKSHHTVKYMTYNDNGTFRENLIEKECMEYSGYAYITRYSNNGILHLIFSYESSEMWNFK